MKNVAQMLADRPDCSVITRRIEWTPRKGFRKLVTDGPYYDDEDEERKDALAKEAIEAGWTPKRWWMWWRWNDHSYPWAAERYSA